MATFHLDGPKKCSGLPVKRYDEYSMLAVNYMMQSSGPRLKVLSGNTLRLPGLSSIFSICWPGEVE